MKTVHIEFIGDYICPWCYLGKVRMEKVRQSLSPNIQLDIEVRPYILYPNIPRGGSPKSNFTKTKPGMGKALRREAQTENIQFNYKLIERIPYSLEAHRLVWLIPDNMTKYEFSKVIFHDYFEKGQDIEEHDYLVTQAKTLGVEDTILHQFMNSKQGEDAVLTYVQQCRANFITVVPYIKISRQLMIPGLQTTEVWSRYIQRAAKRF